MAHIACVAHKRRVLLFDLPVEDDGVQWTAIHRADGSECDSKQLKRRGFMLEGHEIFNLLARGRRNESV
jgi:hypothetical protein